MSQSDREHGEVVGYGSLEADHAELTAENARMQERIAQLTQELEQTRGERNRTLLRCERFQIERDTARAERDQALRFMGVAMDHRANLLIALTHEQYWALREALSGPGIPPVLAQVLHVLMFQRQPTEGAPHA